MKKLILLTSLLAGCVTGKEFRDRDGLYRMKYDGEKSPLLSTPERALRDERGDLIVDADAAHARALNKNPGELEDVYALPDCSETRLYRAKVVQFAAVEDLRAGNPAAALPKLEEAERHCPGIERISAQDYWRARAYAALGDPSKAREAATRFLKKSATVEPASYFQSDGPSATEDLARSERVIVEFAKYRANAEAFLAGRSSLDLLTAPEIAKFTPNAFYRPGGNQRESIIVMPYFGRSEVHGTGFGFGAYYAWKGYGIGASMTQFSNIGAYYGGKLRRAIYESPNRDLNVDLSLLGHTHKRLRYDEVDGEYRNVRVEESAFEVGIGAGATKRWTPAFGVSSELRLYTNQIYHRLDAVGSLYAFYDVWPVGGPTAGYVLNRPFVGWSFLFLQGGYNLRDQSFDLLIEGLSF